LGEGVGRVHPQQAARHAAEAAERRLGLVHVVEDAARVRPQQRAGVCQAQAARRALHQHGADRLLQPGQRTADG
jgi:hypothetical protein